MLRVFARVAVSPIAGFGLFAARPIARGTIVWVRDPALDLAIPVQQAARAHPEILRTLLHYGYRIEGADPSRRADDRYVLCGDDTRFLNHSERPNVAADPEYDRRHPDAPATDFALRDIDAGEELLGDYRRFDLDWPWKLGLCGPTDALPDPESIVEGHYLSLRT